jgi:hypothetical protein
MPRRTGGGGGSTPSSPHPRPHHQGQRCCAEAASRSAHRTEAVTVHYGAVSPTTYLVFCLEGESTHQWPLSPFLLPLLGIFLSTPQTDALFSWVKLSTLRRKIEGGPEPPLSRLWRTRARTAEDNVTRSASSAPSQSATTPVLHPASPSPSPSPRRRVQEHKVSLTALSPCCGSGPSSRGKNRASPMVLCFNLVEPHCCHRMTANACVPTIESSLMPAGAAADDPRARPA